jgi:hypothetical protein
VSIAERLQRRRERARKVLHAPDSPAKTISAAALERQGAEKWLTTLGPRTFTGAFAPFHLEFWDWYWGILRKLLAGERLSLEEMTALLMWGRGMAKSSSAEWAAIAEGALDGSGFVMYVSGTEKQAREHVSAIKARLESSLVASYYPTLSKPEIGARRGAVARHAVLLLLF